MNYFIVDSEQIHNVFLPVCVCGRVGISCVHACMSVQEYLTELQALLHSVAETDFKLNSPEYWPAAYYNLPQQEHCLKVSTALLPPGSLQDPNFLYSQE